MAGHRSVLCFGWMIADRHRLCDSAMIGRLLRVMARATHPSGSPQMLQQFFLQGTAGLNEERAIDRLVGHLARLILRIRALEPPGHLVRRPLELQLVSHNTCERRVLASLQRFGRCARSHAADPQHSLDTLAGRHCGGTLCLPCKADDQGRMANESVERKRSRNLI